MAARGAVVRSLPSVETLGSCSVICSDKTGTLTTNQMSVSHAVTIGESQTKLDELLIEGTSFSPVGEVRTPSGSLVTQAARSAVVRKLAEVCAVCNDATIAYDSKTKTFSNVGEPTEGALKVLVEKLGTPEGVVDPAGKACKERMDECNKYYETRFARQCTYEFSRDRKSMSVLAGSPSSLPVLLVKGAPESILARCTSAYVGANGTKVPFADKTRRMIEDKISEYASKGLRVIAFATVEDISQNPLHKRATTTDEYAQLEQNMTFIGLVGMLDPPRPEVRAAIEKCREAGIRVIVITGDNKQTAETICRQIGVFGPDEDLTGKSFTGREFDSLSESEQLKASQTASLFSRTEPLHKSRLVDLLQQQNHVVAMTGDGVNDAPALKKSDIGVAMGSGTDVAKLAADMVLTDDNFATIQSAIEEGRSIYNNTQQFIRYLISSNIGEVVSIFLTAALGMPEALIPVQLLWVNLVTDGLPATALSFNPPDNDIMKRSPRGRDEPLVTGWLFFRYMVIGTYVGAATVFGYAWWFLFSPSGPQISFSALRNFHRCSRDYPDLDCSIFSPSSYTSQMGSTISLSILVVIEMLNAMNALSSSESLLTMPLWRNGKLVAAIVLSMVLHLGLVYVPVMRGLFGIVEMGVEEWKAVLVISAPVIGIDEVLKWVERRWFMEGTEKKVRAKVE